MVFKSSTSGSAVDFTTYTWIVPADCTITGSVMSSLDSFSAGVILSSASTSAGPWFTISSGDCVSTGYDYNSNASHYAGNKKLKAGDRIKAAIGGNPAPAGTGKFTYGILYTKP
jgi:hypothetical protein